MNKKLISGIVILVVVAVALSAWLYAEKQIVVPPTIPSPATSPVSLPQTTDGYVYDAKLNYGFNYPNGWEFSVSVDKSIAQCDPLLSYEAYNCVEFPDKTIKKVITFTKKIIKDGALISTDIEFTVKAATGSQEVTDKFKNDAELSGMPILNEVAITVNSISGYDILAGTADWKLRQVVFYANGFVYVFKYSSQDEFYRINEETFNGIVNSFSTTATTTALSSVVSDDIADWKTYNSKNYGFEVKYPKNYSAIEKDDMPASYITAFNIGASEFKNVKTEALDEVTFIDSQDADAYKNDETHNGDGHFKTIDVAIYNNGNNYTLEQWFKKNTELTSFEASFTSQKEITVGGVKGMEGIYGCCMAYKTTVFLKNNNKIYKISGNYLEGDPSVIPISNEKMYNQMLSTFKLIK